MKYITYTTYALVLIGALNWGVYGVSGFDLVDLIFGKVPVIARVIYTLVGLSAIYIIIKKYRLCNCTKDCSCCNSSSGSCIDCNSCHDCKECSPVEEIKNN